MSEQFTFLSEPLSAETLPDKLDDMVQEARDRYGYHKMHTSGMYEMIKSAPQSELYDILELRAGKTGDIGFYFDGQLYIKFSVKNGTLNTTQELYRELLSGVPCETLSGSAAPKGGVKVTLPYDEQAAFFSEALEYLIKNKKPANKFGCCSQYETCSREKKCVHENRFYAKGCSYRENLEGGRVFYS